MQGVPTQIFSLNTTSKTFCEWLQTCECHTLIASDMSLHRPPLATQPLRWSYTTQTHYTVSQSKRNFSYQHLFPSPWKSHDHQTWSSRDWSLGLETRFYKSWSQSWSWNLRVLVLEPSSLGLGLGTSESWSWNPRVSVLVLGLTTMKTRFSSLMKREIVSLPPLLLWNGYLASGLLMRANRVRMGDNMLSQLVYLRCNNKL